MALPPGIVPKTVTVGIASFADGSLVDGTVTITAPVNVVHTPSNRPIFSSQMSKRFVDGEATFDLLPTDAPGLNRVDWVYKANVVVSGALVQPEPVYFPLPTAGPSTIDLDGLVTVPSSAGTPVSVPVVTSVNGQTGDVTVAGGGGSGIDAADVGFDLVLLMGQSNMVGTNGGYDPRLDPADSRVFAFDYFGTYAGKVVGAVEPLQHQGGGSGVGPGFPFARWYAGSVQVNRRVLLVPVAASGTSLTATTGSTWNPAVRGNLFDDAVTHAQAALAAAGPNSRFVAVLWVQGESDASLLNAGQITAAQYAATLDSLIAQVRAELAAPALPFIVGSMVPEWVATDPPAQAIQAVHAATPSRVAHTAYAQSPPGGARSDEAIHYSAPGQRVLGRLMAAALPAARANTTPGGGVTPVPPGQITDVTPGAITDTTIALTWSAPSAGTQPITDYFVQYRQAGASGWTTFVDGVGTNTSATVTGLEPSTDYEFNPVAVSAAGTGPDSAIVSASTADAPAPSADFGPTLTIQRGTPTYTASGRFGNAFSAGGVLQVDGLTWAGQTQTVECWIQSEGSGDLLVAVGDGSRWLGLFGGKAITDNAARGGPVINDNQWHHVAAVRVPGGTGRLYVDGTRVFDLDQDSTYANTVFIGAYGAAPGYEWVGQIDEVRLSTGARYTGESFSVPTAPFVTDENTVGLYHLNG